MQISRIFGISLGFAALLLTGSPSMLAAQQPATFAVAEVPAVPALPNAAETQDAQKTQPNSASIVGKVVDQNGAAIAGMSILLAGERDGSSRSVQSDDSGAFTFSDLLPGAYRITLEGKFAEPSPAAIVLAEGEQYQLALTTAPFSTVRTTVNVSATEEEIATAQVKQQEQQKVLGFVPNFYTSYIWDAAPMTSKLKFKLAFRSTIDPVTVLVTAGVAALEQKRNTFPGYEQGGEGLAMRFGATYADTLLNKMLGSAVFPALLHQDPRYFYQGSGTVRSRAVHAILAAFVCRGDNGMLEPNYSQVIGNFTAAGMSNLYRAPSDRQVGLTLRNALIITGSGAVVNVLREFLSRKATPNVPAFANGKP